MAEIINDYTTCWSILLNRLPEEAPPFTPLAMNPTPPGFWERCWADAEERAHRGKSALFLDKVHYFQDWAKRLKGQWDHLRRRRVRVHVVATDSSALRIATGSCESLAGRFERLTLGHWSASSLASVFHLEPPDAASRTVRFGSYPGASDLRSPLRITVSSAITTCLQSG